MAIDSSYYCIPKLAKNQENVQMNFFYKAIVLIFILILIVNITLLALNKINEIIFWAVVVIAAVFAMGFAEDKRKVI